MKRAEEKERGRIEIIMERLIKETVYELGTLPVCIRTPSMLIIGKILHIKSLIFY